MEDLLKCVDPENSAYTCLLGIKYEFERKNPERAIIAKGFQKKNLDFT